MWFSSQQGKMQTEESGARPKSYIWSFRPKLGQSQGFGQQASWGKLPSPQQTWCTASVLQFSGGSCNQGLKPQWASHVYGAFLAQVPPSRASLVGVGEGCGLRPFPSIFSDSPMWGFNWGTFLYFDSVSFHSSSPLLLHPCLERSKAFGPRLLRS